MSDKDSRVQQLIAREAADWFVANRAGLSSKERDAFTAWLRSSPLHVQEYLGIAAISRDLRLACADSANSLETLLERVGNERAVGTLWSRMFALLSDTPTGRLRIATVALGSLAAVAFGLLMILNRGYISKEPAAESVTTLEYSTRHGEQRTYTLADHSVLHLNTDSAVAIRYSKSERLVTLASGEADFEVVHETARPFRVLARSAEVVDVGTRFDVRLTQKATLVTVAEGRVAVRPTQGSNESGSMPAFVQLGSNQQLSVTGDEWPITPTTTDAKRVTAWLHRQILFEGEPLEQVAAEFNRYIAKPIEIESPALKKLEISGIFRSDDTDAFIAFLRSLDGVRVEVTATRIVVSQE
jgi:transmembrane sensor